MAEKQQPGWIGDRFSEGVDNCAGSARTSRQLKNSQGQSLPLSGALPAPVHSAVFMVGQKDFTGRGQDKAGGYRVDGSGHVSREHQPTRIASQEGGQTLARVPE